MDTQGPWHDIPANYTDSNLNLSDQCSFSSLTAHSFVAPVRVAHHAVAHTLPWHVLIYTQVLMLQVKLPIHCTTNGSI